MFERTADLYLNTERTPGQVLLRKKTDATALEILRWISGDRFLLRLWFLTPSPAVGQAPAVQQLPAGSTIAFAAKKNLGDATLLFFAGAGDWSEVGAGSELHYEATLDLNTVELAAAFGTDKTLTATADVEVRDAGNTERLTFQFSVRLDRQAYASESAPQPATPEYPLPGDLLVSDPDGDNLKFGSVLFDVDEQAKAVVFTTAFAAAPRSVRLTLEAPDGDGALPTLGFHTRTAAGFTIVLGAPAPAAGYRVHWEALR